MLSASGTHVGSESQVSVSALAIEVPPRLSSRPSLAVQVGDLRTRQRKFINKEHLASNTRCMD